MSQKTVRILLLEDSATDALLATEAISYFSKQFELSRAERLKDALRLLREKQFDVVLTDLSLPDSHGLETFEKLHAAAIEMPIVILSGSGEEGRAHEAIQRGAQDYLFKGEISRHTIARTIRYAIERKRAELELVRAKQSLEAAVQARTAELTRANASLTKEIVEREKMELEVRKAEVRFRKIFENAVEGIFQTAPHGGFIMANEAMARMLGYGSSKELIAGISNVSSQILADPQRTVEIRRLLNEHGFVRGFEMPYFRKDRSIIWVSVNCHAIYSPDGSVLYYEGTVIDVTERKKTEERLARVASHAHCIIWDAVVTRKEQGFAWDIHFHFTDLLRREFGFMPEPGETETQMWTRIVSVEPGQSKRMNQLSHEALLTNQKGYQQEISIHATDGSKRWLREDVVIERSSSGNWQLVGVAMDITERKRLEEANVQSERLAAIGAMASKLAHEVRNPLTAITLNLEMITDEVKLLAAANPQRADELGKMLATMAGEALRIQNITQEYLKLGRIPKPQKKATDLNLFLTEQLRFLEPVLAKSSTKLTAQFDSNLRETQVDADQIWQATLNLVHNAVDAMGNDGAITIRTGRSSSGITLAVTDTGPGMTPEQRGNLFKPFFTTKSNGTGLGLAMTQQIVVAHGGRIECDSEVGKGTTFTVHLP